MTVYVAWPQDDYDFSAYDVGSAMAGFIQRDSAGVPLPGFIGVAPKVTAVPSAWKAEVSLFSYAAVDNGAVQISGLNGAEQVDITPAAGSVPAGQARIDLICWDAVDTELVVVEGTPAVTPVNPSIGSLVLIASVRVNAADGMVLGGQVLVEAAVVPLTGQEVSEKGIVARRSIGRTKSVTVTVPLTAGKFSSTPMVQVTPTGSGTDITFLLRTSDTTEFSVEITNRGSSTAEVGFHWRVEQ